VEGVIDPAQKDFTAIMPVIHLSRRQAKFARWNDSK